MAFAPSFSADKFTKHKSDSLATVSALLPVNLARASNITGHSYNNFRPSGVPVKPDKQNRIIKYAKK